MPPTLATFLFELVNFLLLAAVLGWLLFTPVRQHLQARQAAEQQRTKALDDRSAEIDRLRTALQQREAAFEQETATLRAARLAAAERDAAAVIAAAREAADREKARAADAMAQLEREELARLADAVAAATRDSVARLLGEIDAPELESALIRSACSRLAALDSGPLDPVAVESAGPLSDAAQEAIRRTLGGRAAAPAFRVVPALGAGLRITTARGVVDASAAGIAATAERQLQAGLAGDRSPAGA